MKAESFFIGPLDDDAKLQISLTLAEAKYLHGMLVDQQEVAPDTDNPQRDNLIVRLDEVIRQTAFEEEKNG
jgi:hypothetical protein